MARNLIQLDVDVTKAAKKLYRLEKKFNEVGRLAITEIGEAGRDYARSISPYYSGRTFRNIKFRRKESDTQVVIVAQNPTASDGHRRTIKNFNLVRWMHQSPLAKDHIKSGNPRFMYATRDYLRRYAPTRVTARFNKVIAEFNRT